MTIFNFFNCRILDDSLNIFKGLYRSTWFIIIVLIIIALQILFVTFAGPAVRIIFWGLHPSGWGLCIGFGLTVWIWGFILRLIPTQRFDIGLGREELKKEDLNKRSSFGFIRKSHNEQFFKQSESLNRRPSQRNSKKLSNRFIGERLPSVKEVIVKSEKFE